MPPLSFGHFPRERGNPSALSLRIPDCAGMTGLRDISLGDGD